METFFSVLTRRRLKRGAFCSITAAFEQPLLPLAKHLPDFQFEGIPINEALVKNLAGGGFLAQ